MSPNTTTIQSFTDNCREKPYLLKITRKACDKISTQQDSISHYLHTQKRKGHRVIARKSKDYVTTESHQDDN